MDRVGSRQGRGGERLGMKTQLNSHGVSRVSRRGLLKGASVAGAAVAFPAIVPPSVLGANAPSGRVNLAAIGVGGRGTDNVRNRFIPLDDVRIVAACDVRRDRREGFAALVNKAYGGNVCEAYNDFREVLRRADVDGVVISTPDHWHVPIALAAARARKDLYVEKPLSIAMKWSWKLRDEVKKNGVVFQYGTQQRGDQAQFRRACELVRNGFIGDVRRVDVWSPDMSSQMANAAEPYGSSAMEPVPEGLDYDLWIGPAPMMPYTKDRCTCYGAYHIDDYSLGFIAGWAVHPLDVAQWGLGNDHTSPVKYAGSGSLPPAGTLWDTVESWDVACTYADGVELRNMGHRVAEPVVRNYRVWRDHGTTFHGSEGWVSVDRTGMYSSDKNLASATLPENSVRLRAAKSHARDFVDCIRSRAETISPLEAAIRCDTISHLSDLSVRFGREIRWDALNEKIVADAEAEKALDRGVRGRWMA